MGPDLNGWVNFVIPDIRQVVAASERRVGLNQDGFCFCRKAGVYVGVNIGDRFKPGSSNGRCKNSGVYPGTAILATQGQSSVQNERLGTQDGHRVETTCKLHIRRCPFAHDDSGRTDWIACHTIQVRGHDTAHTVPGSRIKSEGG